MKISIVIPCWNVEALLPATLDSVLAQSHTDWEIIAVDDGSADDTPAVLRHTRGRRTGGCRCCVKRIRELVPRATRVWRWPPVSGCSSWMLMMCWKRRS
ncbi:MAG: glycosyltransferase [Flavobacteriales bacterium]|nr:glycosyltransferase [Flavobacteriales bacterium]